MWASVTAWPSATARSSVRDLPPQPLNVILQQMCCDECLAVHVPHHCQGLLIWIKLNMSIHSLGPRLELWWRVRTWSNSRISLLCQLGGSLPSQILRWTGRSSQPLHHHRGFLLATSSNDTYHCRYFLYLLGASWVRQDPWWGLPPSDPIQGRAAFKPGEWSYHVPSCHVWWHGRTSGGGWRASVAPISGTHQGRYWHPTAIPPPSRYVFLGPQSLSLSSFLCLAFIAQIK